MSDVVKKPRSLFDIAINVMLIAALVYLGFRYSGLLYPSTKVNSSAQAQAIMYSTKWCPVCVEARGFFARNKISYVEYDIEASEKRRQQFYQLGGQGVPLVLVGETTIFGLQKSKILKAIRLLSADKQSTK